MSDNGSESVTRLLVFTLVLALVTSALGVLPTHDPREDVDASGITNGNLLVDDAVAITKLDYKIDGNIVVQNGGTLTVTDSTLTVISDGSHKHSITVESGGTLDFLGGNLTSTTKAVDPYLDLVITVEAGGTATFDGVALSFPGHITVDGGTLNFMSSTTTGLIPPAYDFDGDGFPGTSKDIDLNDDGPTFGFLNGGYGYIVNSVIDKMFEYDQGAGASLEFQTRNFTVDDSEVHIFDTSIDVDFRYEGNLTTPYGEHLGHHNAIHLTGASQVDMYNVTVSTYETAGNIIDPAFTTSNTSAIHYYRWLKVNVTDAAGIPLNGSFLSVNWAVNDTAHYAPTAAALKYLDKTAPTFGETDIAGVATIPVLSDIFNSSFMPNSLFVGNYKLSVDYLTFSTSTNLGLEFYPNIDATDNKVSLELSLNDLLLDPALNPYYSQSGNNVVIDGVVNEIRYPVGSYGGQTYLDTMFLSGNLQVKNSGSGEAKLRLVNTTLRVLQDQDTHFYIALYDNATLELVNSQILDHTGEPLTIFMFDTSGLIANNSGIDTHTIAMRDSSSLYATGTVIASNFNAYAQTGSDAISIDVLEGSDVFADSLYLRAESVASIAADFTGSDITLADEDSLELMNAELTLGSGALTVTKRNDAEAEVFSIEDDTFIEMTSLRLSVAGAPAELHDEVEIDAGSAGNVTIYWYINVKVVDMGANALEDAKVEIYYYDDGFNLRKYGDPVLGKAWDTTNSNGFVQFKALSMEVDAFGMNFHGDYYVKASYAGLDSMESRSIGAFGARADPNLKGDVDINLTIPAAPDLTPSGFVYEQGDSLIAGNNITLKLDILNKGVLGSKGTEVSFEQGGSVFAEILIDGLPGTPDAPANSVIVDVEWIAVQGSVQINATVDPANRVGELRENNNKITLNLTIAAPPDVNPFNVTFTNPTPTVGDTITITAEVSNWGGYAPDIPVNVTFWDGNPDMNTDGVIDEPLLDTTNYLGNTIIQAVNTVSDALNNNGSAAFEWEAGWLPRTGEYRLGGHNIYVMLLTKIDSNLENNTAYGSVYVKQKADLTLSPEDILFIPLSPVGEETKVTVNVTIHNQGETDSGAFNVEIFDTLVDEEGAVLAEAVSIDILSLSNVAAGGVGWAEVVWEARPVGNHSISVEIDKAGLASEYDLENNNASAVIEVGDKPDFRISKLTLTVGTNTNITTITNGTIVRVDARVTNIGKIPQRNVLIRVFDNSWYAPIGKEILFDNLPAGESRDITAYITMTQVGKRKIVVHVDPFDSIDENDEDNNKLEVFVTVIKKADLTLDVVDISFLLNEELVYENPEGVPEVPNGAEVTVRLTIRNVGFTDVSRVVVQIFDGAPNPGAQIEWNENIGNLKVGHKKTINATWTNTEEGGTHEIYVVLDPFNEVDEVDEDNNVIHRAIYVFTKPDLNVKGTSIRFLSAGMEVDYVGEGQPIDIEADIFNNGDTRANYVDVHFYDGDPEHGGTVAGTAIASVRLTFVEGRDSMVARLEDYTFDDPGVHFIYVKVDPQDTIEEGRETNNLAYSPIEVLGIETYDLSFSEAGISFWVQGGEVTAISNGSFATVKVNVENVVTAVEGVAVTIYQVNLTKDLERTDDERLRLHSEIIDIPANEFVNVSTTFNARMEGTYMFEAEVDSNNTFKEYRENNNLVTGMLEVLPLPDLTVDMASFAYPGTEQDPNRLYIYEALGQNSVSHIFEVNIVNTGVTSATNVQVLFFLDQRGGTQIHEEFITVNPESFTTVQAIPYVFTQAMAGQHDVVVVVNPKVQGEFPVPETDYQNNEGESDPFTIVFVEAPEPPPPSTEDWTMIILVIIMLIIIVVVVIVVVLKRGRDKPALCSECGNPLDLTDTECPKCGAEFGEEVECGECGELMSLSDTTCASCGAIFVEGAGEEKKPVGDEKVHDPMPGTTLPDKKPGAPGPRPRPRAQARGSCARGSPGGRPCTRGGPGSRRWGRGDGRVLLLRREHPGGRRQVPVVRRGVRLRARPERRSAMWRRTPQDRRHSRFFPFQVGEPGSREHGSPQANVGISYGIV